MFTDRIGVYLLLVHDVILSKAKRLLKNLQTRHEIPRYTEGDTNTTKCIQSCGSVSGRGYILLFQRVSAMILGGLKLAREKAGVENAIGMIKRFKIVSDKYRNRRKRLVSDLTLLPPSAIGR